MVILLAFGELPFEGGPLVCGRRVFSHASTARHFVGAFYPPAVLFFG